MRLSNWKEKQHEYEVGEFLICREHTKSQTCVFTVNAEHIFHIGIDIITLKNVKTNMLQQLEIDNEKQPSFLLGVQPAILLKVVA